MPEKNKLHPIFSKGISSVLAETLRKARKQQQLTQAELAQMVGLKQSSIAKIESSKADIPTQRFLEICRVLGYEIVLVPKEKLSAVKTILKPQSQSEEYSDFKDLLGVIDNDEDAENESDTYRRD